MQILGKIHFHTADRQFIFQNKTFLKQSIIKLFSEELTPLKRLDYVFCSNNYLLEINKTFLQHNYFTDIITFDLSETKEIIGEIYISIDQVKENAGIHKTIYRDEILRVIFHGALHLCGFKDKKRKDVKLMREKENHYINKFHVELLTHKNPSVSRGTKH